MVELVDTRDLKSLDPKRSCGFESRSRHPIYGNVMLKIHLNSTGIVMATTLAVTIFAFALTACSSAGKGFKIDARFLNMNQANFYVYSPDGVISGIDTISVRGGRFTYQKETTQEGTIVLVFPNFAVMPVFVSPGADISIEANAAHLKNMEITGTDDNKVFTEWRKNCDGLSPAEMRQHAELFIKDNPRSMVSLWLLRQYFLLPEQPDVKKAMTLMQAMRKSMNDEDKNTPQALLLTRMINETGRVKAVNVGDPLPRIKAKDIDGNPITNGQLLKGHTVVCVWTSWNAESCNALRQLASNRQFAADSAKVDNIITVCLDPDIKQCRRTLKNNNAEALTTVCDGLMWDSPLVKELGVTTVPYNLKAVNGKITGRRQPVMELLKKK